MSLNERQITDREIKALQIAAKHKLTRKGNVWFVPSQAGKGEYEVRPDPQAPRCTCPDYEYRNARCKHVLAVEYVLMREQTSDGQTVVTETVKVTRKTYTQNWTAYNEAQTHEKSEMQAYLYELCRNLPEPMRERGKGRPPLSLPDVIFASVTKIYSTISGRRFQTDLREAKARGYLAHLPHYNSVFKYLESEALTPYLYELISLSAAPLKAVETDFAVDSSGFSTGQFVRWLDVKNSTKEDRRHWLKLHLMVGTKTNIVTSVEVSDGFAHDYPFFKGLVDRTADAGFKLREVSADKGYLGADNMLATLRRGAIPYIPFKTNSVAQSGWEPKSQLWTRMFHFYSLNRAEFLQHYHKRSNVETTFHMIKSKFGQRLRSRTLTAQVNEALCKVLCHNLCVVLQSVHELGLETDFEVAHSV
ncbi:MAG: transposase [Acidobacteria bacterium]|nr:transposase [Acidobacteriota bacterium]